MALDVTQCSSEREKLQWAFRLYDVDGSGSITVKEMENIIQTLDRVNIHVASIFQTGYFVYHYSTSANGTIFIL